jgi:hypothetical protein
VPSLNRFTAALIVFSLAACGGKSLDFEDPDEQGGTGGTGQGGAGNVAGKGGRSGTAGTTQGGSVGKGGTAGTGGSIGMAGEGGSAGLCSAYDDESPALSNVNVAIHNQTSAPIYLGQEMVTCAVAPLFQVQDAAGKTYTLGPDSSCRQRCNAEVVGCPTICPYPTTIALQPGEVYNTQWSAMYFEVQQLPPECTSPNGSQQCSQVKAARAGVYTFSAFAGSGVDCSAVTGTCGACVPDSGGCSLPGSVITGVKHKATTTETLDSTFGLYSLPAPLPGAEPMSGFPAPPVRIVNLIFTE